MADKKSIFPEGLINKSSGNSDNFTLEGIAGKLTYFHEQLHLIHWQTESYAEHQAIGSLYDAVHDFKDDVIEKLMGYTGKRIGLYKIEALSAKDSTEVVKSLEQYAHSLYEWAEEQEYCDIENMAQDLSGKAAKTLYLLTLS